jgi:hypothetical protein
MMLPCLAALLGFAAAASAQNDAAYRQPPITVKSADFLPQKLPAPAGCTVAPEAENDGLVNRYSITCGGGTDSVESTQALLTYLQERAALEKIEKISKTNEFKEAFKKAGLGPYYTAKGLVTEPVNTVKKVGTGIGRWFSDVGSSVTSKDPNQPGVAKTALGQAGAKRAYAYRLDVNPYTGNRELQEKLDSLAWVAFSGGLTVKVAFAAIPDVVGTVISLSSFSDSMKRKVRDNSPAQLHDLNKKALTAMGATPHIAEEFLNNYLYDPYDKTLIVGALESMKGVKNRAQFIVNCFGVKDREVALFTRNQAECMAAYAEETKGVTALVDVAGKTFLRTGDNAVVAVYPLDYIAWTENLDTKERLFSEAIGKLKDVTAKRLVVYGKVDPQARTVLEGRGWSIVEKKIPEPQAQSAKG